MIWFFVVELRFTKTIQTSAGLLGRSSIFLPNSYRCYEGTKMIATATLSSKFQISIPKAVREEQHWEAGQEFVFIPKGKGVLVMPVPELDQLAGIAKGARKDDYRDRQDRY